MKNLVHLHSGFLFHSLHIFIFRQPHDHSVIEVNWSRNRRVALSGNPQQGRLGSDSAPPAAPDDTRSAALLAGPRPWVPARTLGLGVGVVVYIRRFTEMLSGKNTSIKIQLERTNRICYLTCRSEQKLYFPVSSQGQSRPSRTARAPPPQPSGDARGAHPRRLASTLPAARNTLPGTPRGLPPLLPGASPRGPPSREASASLHLVTCCGRQRFSPGAAVFSPLHSPSNAVLKLTYFVPFFCLPP